MLRVYDENNMKVYDVYKKMHINQTVRFVKSQKSKYNSSIRCRMTISDIIDDLRSFVDVSDPDFSDENIYHGYQTAEAIREKYPEYDWYHLVGLLHDLGKILYKFDEEQWSIVGDTYPVGCKYSDKIVYSETLQECIDSNNSSYNTKYGIYIPNCGLRNVLMSYGHDEYFANVLNNNVTYLPKIAIDIIRFHSFYSWHSENEYRYLMDNYDHTLLEWINDFNRFDLYSKTEKFILTDEIVNYYNDLINKYIPDLLNL
jgi:inositol oxygenase